MQLIDPNISPFFVSKSSKGSWGLIRTIINYMIVGVEEGFTKTLIVNGVGYRASVGDGILTLQLGYSHYIKLAIPKDLEVKCTKPTEISISGIDKQKVGQFASEVRALRKPEPCLLYTSPSPRDRQKCRMPSSA